MPKYVYKCPQCEETYEIVHSFSETVQYCSEINPDSRCDDTITIERIPQVISLLKKQNKKAQAGHIVDEFIKDTKKEVKEYKEDMINWKLK